jgi:16S rRNA (guanine1516-N2)-methyltransferase
MDSSHTRELEMAFAAGSFGYRIAHLNKGEHLLRAVGVSKEEQLHVVDGTAGLGRDGFLLAAAGARVTLIERSPAVFDLLQRSLAAARDASAGMAAIVDRIETAFGDSRDLLAKIDADVILIDPMHPERKKAALVKQPMRALRAVVGNDPDRADLIRAALDHSPGKVVVKWPTRVKLPDGIPAPTFELRSRTVRHCVFISSVGATRDSGS